VVPAATNAKSWPSPADEIQDSIRRAMGVRFRNYRDHPSPQNAWRLQTAMVAYQVFSKAYSGSATYRTQLVAQWNECGGDLERFTQML
jgi:maltooligosyltrehalose synthase